MSNEKKFFGNVKTIATQYGEMTKISFKKTELAEMINNCNDKGYFNLVIKESKNKPGTKYMEQDTFVPMNNPANTSNEPQSDLPW